MLALISSVADAMALMLADISSVVPATVLDWNLMSSADEAIWAETLDRSVPTILKNNLSWHLMYPSANTTPWQLEGTILALQDAGLTDLVCVENQTVVTNARIGETLNKQRPVCDHYAVPIKYNFVTSDMTWQRYDPTAEMLVLERMFSDGVLELLPERPLQEQKAALCAQMMQLAEEPLSTPLGTLTDRLVAELGVEATDAPVDDVTLLLVRFGPPT